MIVNPSCLAASFLYPKKISIFPFLSSKTNPFAVSFWAFHLCCLFASFYLYRLISAVLFMRFYLRHFICPVFFLPFYLCCFI